MAIAFLEGAQSTQNAVAVASFPIPVPNASTPLVAGDFLIACWSMDTANTTAPTMTLPSGWTAFPPAALVAGSASTTVAHQFAYHIVTAGEAGTTPTWTVTFTSGSYSSNCAVSRFSGVDNASPFAMASPFYNGTIKNTASTSSIAPAVTTTQPNAMVVTGLGIRNGSGALTSGPAGYTVGGNAFLGAGRSVALAHILQAAAGASGTATWTYATSSISYAWQTALNPSTVTPDTTAPTVPTGVTAVANSSTQVTISWTASTDAVGVASYRVMRNGTALAGASAVAGTSFVDTSAVASTAYSYTVSAVDSAGNRSAESTAANVTTPSSAGTYSYAILGVPDSNSVPVTIKSVGAGSVRIKVGTNSTVTTGTAFTSAQTPDSSQLSRHVISGLAANTQYWYQEEIDGVLGSVRGSFKTDVPVGTAKSFRVAFSSCLTSGNATGTAFDNIIANNPELFIHLGDWHYDNDTTTSQSAHVASLESQINGNASLKSMLRQYPLAYVWSDHDSGNNDWTGGPASWTPSYNSAYRQIIPVEGTLPTGGVYRSFGRGRVKFIITDGRSYKSPAANADNSSKTMFGTTQESWIASELADPNYPVKILCVDVPWVYPTTAGDDKWGGYTAAANRLVADIASSGAKVFMIHGDAHTLCADDGSSANNRGALPVAGAAPLGNTTSLKGGPYSQGTYPTSTGGSANQHGLLDITDTGTQITVRFSGRDTTNTERVILSKTFAATSAAVAVKAGSTAVNALKVGTAVVDKAYVGTSQIWP